MRSAIAEVHLMRPPEAASGAALDSSDVKLSARELDVLRLLMVGHTDREIAEKLFIGIRTVEGHVARVLAKLGAPTRTAAAHAAVAAGVSPNEDISPSRDG